MIKLFFQGYWYFLSLDGHSQLRTMVYGWTHDVDGWLLNHVSSHALLSRPWLQACRTPLSPGNPANPWSASLRGHRMTFSHSSKDPLLPLRQGRVPRRGEGVDKSLRSLVVTKFATPPAPALNTKRNKNSALFALSACKTKTLLSLSHAKVAKNAETQCKPRCRWISRLLRTTENAKA